MKQNHSFFIFYKLITVFHFSPAGKKRKYFPVYVFEKTRVSCYKLCEENKRIKLQMLALKKYNFTSQTSISIGNHTVSS